MSRYKQGEAREQMRLEPLSFEDMVSPDNPVRAIDAIVEIMEIPALGFTYGETKTTGRKPYSPVDMFKLYAYSYFNGIRTSRKIERECHRNIEVMWLVNELKPDFKTIANFRKDNKQAIKAAFGQFTLICDELGLISKEVVAVDGSKFRASNGRMRYHSKGKIAEKLLHYSESAEKYMNLLEQCDKEEADRMTGYRPEELQERLAQIQKRVTELEAISRQVEAEGTIYLTDSDARLMRAHNGGGDISHNTQIAVEEQNHFVVAVDVSSDAVDYKQLHNIANLAKEALRVDELTAIADKGYYSGEQFSKCAADGVRVIAPHPEKGGDAERGYTKGFFVYDKDKDYYICPGGSILAQPKQRKSNRKGKYYYNRAACTGCPHKEKCIPRVKYRTIVRKEFEDYMDEVDTYTRQNRELYSKRKNLVEHPFGTVKRALGFSYFLTRGTENVRTESMLHFLAYNMKRLINILGVEELSQRLLA